MSAGQPESSAPASDRPIAVFDSGLGGLTVVRRIRERIPGADLVYLGDSARVPYGIKSPEVVRDFAVQDAAFLLRFDPKLLVAACNTASAVALDALEASVPVPVVGVVRPVAARAVALAGGGPIAVIGTEATIASGAHARAVAAAGGGSVLAAAAPLLVPIVEEGRPQGDPVVLAVLSDYLRELQRARPAVLILGCTHYPLLARAIAKVMGPDTRLLDPGESAAEAVAARLGESPLQSRPGGGKLKCFSTGSPERFARLARRFLGRDVGEVTRVGTDELVLGTRGAAEP